MMLADLLAQTTDILNREMPEGWTHTARATKNLIHVTATTPGTAGMYRMQTNTLDDVREFIAMCQMFAHRHRAITGADAE